MSTPTLNELLERMRHYTPYRRSAVQLYRQVASGKRHPTKPPLPESVVILACQAMAVLFEHVDNNPTLLPYGDADPYTLTPGYVNPGPEIKNPWYKKVLYRAWGIYHKLFPAKVEIFIGEGAKKKWGDTNGH